MKISGPGESSLLLLKVIKRLDKLRIPYAIIGAFAASFYGLVRASLDADAVISVGEDREKLHRLVAALKKGGWSVKAREGGSGDPIRCVINIEDKFKNRVDLLIGIRRMQEDMFGRVMTASFLNANIRIIGIEDFIAMKMFAGSAKDIQDVIGVLQVSSRKIDRALLRQLTLRYGKKELERLEAVLRNRNRDT